MFYVTLLVICFVEFVQALDMGVSSGKFRLVVVWGGGGDPSF